MSPFWVLLLYVWYGVNMVWRQFCSIIERSPIPPQVRSKKTPQ